MGDDKVQLTDREREALAGLAEQIGDPWLARQLSGHDDGGPDEQPSNSGGHPAHAALRNSGVRNSGLRRINAATAPAWVAIVMVFAGAALSLATFARSIPVASVGLLVMGAGAWLLLVEHSGLIARRINERRADVPGPAFPPRRPPATP